MFTLNNLLLAPPKRFQDKPADSSRSQNPLAVSMHRLIILLFRNILLVIVQCIFRFTIKKLDSKKAPPKGGAFSILSHLTGDLVIFVPAPRRLAKGGRFPELQLSIEALARRHFPLAGPLQLPLPQLPAPDAVCGTG